MNDKKKEFKGEWKRDRENERKEKQRNGVRRNEMECRRTMTKGKVNRNSLEI